MYSLGPKKLILRLISKDCKGINVDPKMSNVGTSLGGES